MDVARLRVLRELADRGSVTAVAAALSFTPSAISQQLRALAAEVGVPLTEPAGRGLRLTPAGHALVAQAEEGFTALARAQAAVGGVRSLPGGEGGVGLFPARGRVLLGGALRRRRWTGCAACRAARCGWHCSRPVPGCCWPGCCGGSPRSRTSTCTAATST